MIGGVATTAPAALECDVLVVGAGPAGSALAQRLARRGWSVVLADQKAFPRRKPCGEFLSPECAPHLRDLGVEAALLQAGACLVHGMRLHAGRRRAVGHFRAVGGDAGDRPRTVPGFGVRRELLDTRLLDAARRRPEVRWLERHALDELVRDDRGAVTGAVLRGPDRAPTAVRARYTVGADGVRSRVARQLGVQRPLRWLDRFALITRYDGVPALGTAEVHLLGRGAGYFAATAVDGGHFHLNLVVDRRELAERTGDWDDFAAAHLRRAPALQDRLHAATRVEPWRGTGPLAFTTTRQALPGAALVGDACGYVDPLTGEGIYFALATAALLDVALDAALRAPARAAAALRGYERARRRELGPRLFLARLLQRGLRHPWLVRGCVGALARHPRLADALVTLTGDGAHPRDLLRPAFWRALRPAAGTA